MTTTSPNADSADETRPADGEPQVRPWWKPLWLAKHLRTIVVVPLALAGAWFAIMTFGTTHGFVGPLTVDATIQPSASGDSIVEVDPVGTLVLDTHDSPVTLHVSVRAVDTDGLNRIVNDPDALTSLDERLVDDLNRLLIESAIRTAVVAILGAVVASLLVLRTVRHALLALATGVVSVGGAYGLAALTYNQEAVREPTYTGLLELAPEVVGTAEEISVNFDAYAEQLASIVTGASALYNATLSLPTYRPDDNAIKVLLVADLHLNVTSWNIMRAVSNQYDVDVIVDAGDIADHGTQWENAYVDDISTLGRPYVYVKGNHDSVATVAAIAAEPNAVILDGYPTEVAGLRFLGAPDPRFTPDQSTRDTGAEDIERGTQELADLASRLINPVDAIVYHDPEHADLFDGTAPLVLSGHKHQRSTYVMDEGTRVFIQGSTGGAGLRALEDEEPTPVMFSVLYFDPETKGLMAWDDFTLGGIGLSSAKIERTLANGDDDVLAPTESPIPPSLPSDDETLSPSPSPADNATEPGQTGTPATEETEVTPNNDAN